MQDITPEKEKRPSLADMLTKNGEIILDSTSCPTEADFHGHISHH